MSVSLQDGTIRLSGPCGVEEAETLVGMLEANPGAAVDLSGAGQVHTALWQVLLVVKPQLFGAPANPFYRDWILPAVSGGAPDDPTT